MTTDDGTHYENPAVKNLQTSSTQVSTQMARLPNFLIIGAMKAGTTSLYHDLIRHPRVFMPEVKEPDALLSDEIFTKRQSQWYSDLFQPASPDQLCGEASTTYTKRPIFEGVAERALRLIGNELKLIYIVRNPLQRTLSHHRFLYQLGLMDKDINRAIQNDPTLIDYSRYAIQLEPWLATFGSKAVYPLLFESYIDRSQERLTDVLGFLGLPPLSTSIKEGHIHNRTSDLRPLRGFWRRVRESRLYLNVVRPMIPGRGRSKMGWLRRHLAKGPLPDPVPATIETKDYIISSLRDDVARFAKLADVDTSPWKEFHDHAK